MVFKPVTRKADLNSFSARADRLQASTRKQEHPPRGGFRFERQGFFDAWFIACAENALTSKKSNMTARPGPTFPGKAGSLDPTAAERRAGFESGTTAFLRPHNAEDDVARRSALLIRRR
jgi:hypothetical protein